MTERASLLLMLALLMVPVTVMGHHSIAANFDVTEIIELEGRLTQVRWQNPHVRFTVQEEDGDRWEIETNSVSILRRMDLSSDVLRVGDTIRVAGHPGRRSGDEIFALNLLLPGTEEVLLRPGSQPRWSAETIGTSETWLASSGDASDPARGLFRVWSSSLATGLGFWNRTYPLTPTARAASEQYDPIADSPILDCRPKGMPTIMEQPYPMEFLDEGPTIRLRLEEYDTVRTIHLDQEPAGSEEPLTDLGYSVGRWEGETLVVTTTRVGWSFFNTTEGIPQSEAVEIVERFTPDRDRSGLDYTMTVTDPATFTEPVVLRKSWISLPDVRVEPYDCRV